MLSRRRLGRVQHTEWHHFAPPRRTSLCTLQHPYPSCLVWCSAPARTMPYTTQSSEGKIEEGGMGVGGQKKKRVHTKKAWIIRIVACAHLNDHPVQTEQVCAWEGSVVNAKALRMKVATLMYILKRFRCATTVPRAPSISTPGHSHSSLHASSDAP